METTILEQQLKKKEKKIPKKKRKESRAVETPVEQYFWSK